jgi:diguanylate cyclase (GGDEF)-like protein
MRINPVLFASPDRPPTPSSRRWVVGVLVAAVVAVALACVLSVQHLRANADDAQRKAVAALNLAHSVEQLNGLEWQAVAQSRLSGENSETAAGLISALPVLARRATGDDGGVAQGPHGSAATVDRYRQAVKEEFALLGAGEAARARAVDRSRVDPTATSLKATLATSTAAAVRLAATQSRNADRLSLVIVILGATLGMFLFWRLERGLATRHHAAMLSENAHELREQASQDVLTGLPNRRQLLADLAHVIDEQYPVALIFFDLDGFKTYNDRFGHSQGDLLLARLGKRMAVAATEGGAYRLGGDEFCALVHDNQHLPASLTGLLAALREERDSFEVSASYGLVHLPAEAHSVTNALRTADVRMYENKGAGRKSAAQQTTHLAVSVVAEYDRGLHEHADGVAETADAVGRRLNLDDIQLADVWRVAQLHDIGKVGLPRTILDKAGALDPDELEFIWQHTIIGDRILASAPALKHIAQMVRSSHERYDGMGYPDQLAGEAIPLISRIVFVCDSFDAMTHDRPYRATRSAQQARAEIRRGSGTQFDPDVVDAFLAATAPDGPADGSAATAAAPSLSVA